LFATFADRLLQLVKVNNEVMAINLIMFMMLLYDVIVKCATNYWCNQK